MPDANAMRIAVGDKVRAHYYPPGERVSFVEGVVRRLDVTTRAGRGFLIDITHDVILGREQRVQPGYQHYVLYERSDDFPGRVEVLAPEQREAEPEPGRETMLEHELEAEPTFQPGPELKDEREPEPESVRVSGPEQFDTQGARGLGSVIGVLFGRRA
jgi:hypothetical protein